MTEPVKPELLNCPFCGEMPRVYVSDSVVTGPQTEDIKCNTVGCPASPIKHAEWSNREAWNRRSPVARPGEGEALHEMAELLERFAGLILDPARQVLSKAEGCHPPMAYMEVSWGERLRQAWIKAAAPAFDFEAAHAAVVGTDPLDVAPSAAPAPALLSDEVVLDRIAIQSVREMHAWHRAKMRGHKDEALEQAAKVADDRRQFQESGVEATETSDGRADEARIIAASIRALQERGKAP